MRIRNERMNSLMIFVFVVFAFVVYEIDAQWGNYGGYGNYGYGNGYGNYYGG